MGTKVGSGSCSRSQAYSVYVVLRNKGVYRSYVYLACCLFRASFHEVFGESLYHEHNGFEAFGAPHALNEVAHIVLALR